MYLNCAVCGCAWCWKCGDYGLGKTGRPAPHHVHQCNNPPAEQWVNSAASLFSNDGRFWWYFERYEQHMKSKKFAISHAEKITTTAYAYEDKGLAADLQCLPAACQAIIEARPLLACTYVAAFFEADENRRKLFQTQQNYLEETTEKLSGMTEKEIEIVRGLRPQILSLTSALRNYMAQLETWATSENSEAKDLKLKA